MGYLKKHGGTLREDTLAARTLGYLCFECAEACGGKWSEGHRATAHHDLCNGCGQMASLCHWTDWDWPGFSPKYGDLDPNTQREL